MEKSPKEIDRLKTKPFTYGNELRKPQNQRPSSVKLQQTKREFSAVAGDPCRQISNSFSIDYVF
jgi:hypothetical protein